MSTPDVIVVGLGAAGAATLYQLARRGISALGIDSHSPPHNYGSTHGDTRITREAIGEGMQYTPLVRRSHAIWRELEAETGQDLLTQCGGLIIEAAGGGAAGHHRHDFLSATTACANHYGVPHERLDAAEVIARFPQFHLDGDESAYYEPGAGFVRPERCVEAQLTIAERLGARVVREERVLAIESNEGIVRVRTERDVYEAPRAVLAVGPWIEGFIDQRELVLFRIYRQVLTWFPLRGGAVDHAPGVMPVFIWGLSDGNAFYGFPEVDGAGTIKIATEQLDITTTAESASMEVEASETRSSYELFGRRLPALSPDCERAVRCLYTVTPDANFVVDEHPDLPGVMLVSPCSGHGFKHSAGLGEAIAQLLTTGMSDVDLSPFRIGRFSEFRAAG
ncbi:MAG TPA: N-methyl-L-tryptophan oxidase [Candidatus Saccharimonadales bacterium]|nr:N-methyl-L-tryptophan oxidase [Candidatus Saccharimonadales bacterium]